jgi:hypothetical protein
MLAGVVRTSFLRCGAAVVRAQSNPKGAVLILSLTLNAFETCFPES